MHPDSCHKRRTSPRKIAAIRTGNSAKIIKTIRYGSYYHGHMPIMGYVERICKAVDEAELRLPEGLTLEEAARLAYMSPFHFHRVFQAVAGETFASYQRRRRLSLAAERLLSTRDRLIDISLDSLFGSQESFSRAFKKQFGAAPAAFRRAGRRKPVRERGMLTAAQLTHRRTTMTMKPEIVELNDFGVVGVKFTNTLKNNKLSKAWKSFSARVGEIEDLTQPPSFCGLSLNMHANGASDFSDETPYEAMIAARVRSSGKIPQGMTRHIVRGGRYARFEHKGEPSSLRLTYNYIYGVWLLSSGLQLGERDDFELYDERFLGPDNPDSSMFIYIPVK